jgi:acyloxyacyl hydrolase
MTHPLGVPFPAVYDFLGCNQCSPCLGWLNSNSSFRDATSQRAAELSAVYGQIIAANSTRYSKFDMYTCVPPRLARAARPRPLSPPPPHTHTPSSHYFPANARFNVDWHKFISNYTDAGGRAFDLIEPVDGFHPSQTGNMLLAEMLWEDLAANRPGWLPPVNPNNDAIRARFGDQVRLQNRARAPARGSTLSSPPRRSHPPPSSSQGGY